VVESPRSDVSGPSGEANARKGPKDVDNLNSSLQMLGKCFLSGEQEILERENQKCRDLKVETMPFKGKGWKEVRSGGRAKRRELIEREWAARIITSSVWQRTSTAREPGFGSPTKTKDGFQLRL
jgi:hypothetical protein